MKGLSTEDIKTELMKLGYKGKMTSIAKDKLIDEFVRITQVSYPAMCKFII